MRVQKKISAALQYGAVTGAISLIPSLPCRAATALGRSLGMLAWLCVPLHRRIAEMQIRSALGDADERSMARRVFMHCGHGTGSPCSPPRAAW